MASPSLLEKDALPSTNAHTTPIVPSYFTPVSPFFNAYDRITRWRQDLGLPYPGSVENTQKEVKATHLTNYIFDGARADLTKNLSFDPLFQLTHSFVLGSSVQPASYSLGVTFARENLFLQGTMDHEGSVNARFNHGWTANNIFKAQAQLSQQAGHNMIQLEHDFIGTDYHLNFKAVNPSPADGSGVYIGSYLQSITKNLALGVESLYQRAAQNSDLANSYLAKVTSTDKSWIATAQVQPQGVLQATYWQKLSEKVEVAADLQVINAPTRRDAIATLGARYDFRAAQFRAQVDSTGKVSALLEQRFVPAFAFLVSGEIDHFKNNAKVGVGIMIESSSLSPEEMAALAAQQQPQL
ncbi:eukaryotic porin-domain-containing protein [Pholiota molesta]|nr:eukaryotic porin-domain-containing protein [Pholiota molesta]